MQQILLLSKMKLLLRKSVTLLHLWLSKSGDVTMNNSSFSRMRLEIRPAIFAIDICKCWIGCWAVNSLYRAGIKQCNGVFVISAFYLVIGCLAQGRVSPRAETFGRPGHYVCFISVADDQKVHTQSLTSVCKYMQHYWKCAIELSNISFLWIVDRTLLWFISPTIA